MFFECLYRFFCQASGRAGFFALCACLAAHSALAGPQQRSAAFFYAAPLPTPELAQFDDVIVEPLNTHPRDIGFLQRQGSLVFAYLSLGEISDANARRFDVPENWMLGRNAAWRSSVLDQRNADWRQWLLSTRVSALAAAGYDGLFLDTLDSFHLVAKTPKQREAQIAGLVETIRSIRRQYPKMKLYFNRGFELLPALQQYVHAMAVESLFAGWNPTSRKYRTVPAGDRDWLLDQLNTVTAMNIPVTVIDYVAPKLRNKAVKTAHKISALGFTPWVSVPELNQLGVGTVEVMPRRALVIYDSREGPLALHPAHVLLGNPLDYLGLRIDYHDINDGVPVNPLHGLYAGVITWLDGSAFADLKKFEHWLMRQMDLQIPLAVINGFPFRNPHLLQKMGIKPQRKALKKPLTIKTQSAHVGNFEARVKPKSRGFSSYRNTSKKNAAWLTLQDARGSVADPVIMAPWGGAALFPYVSSEMRPGFERWIIEPIEFLRSALKIRDLPVADSTTENGSRILTSHVDGDGSPSRAELPNAPYSGEVLLEKIFKPYRLPHTVSVIEGELGAKGLYPKQSPALEDIARRIFSLPNVELASHSFSHPFFWQPQKINTGRKMEYGLSMPIPGYQVDYRREIIGSINYINRRLAPPGKKVKVMLWTGDALPGSEAISLVEEAGVANLNGGNTKVTFAYPSITGIYPQLRPTPAGPQIYAPVMNENVYTNEWHGPYYGYRQVIETFKLTNSPRRFKPISIYWHFYSGTKQSSLKALYDVYDWALAQQHTAMYISEFAPRVEGTYTTSYSRAQDGAVVVKGVGALRTLRIPDSMGYPDLSRSTGLAGFIDLPQGRYLHLSDNSARLYFQQQQNRQQPYLRQANAMVRYWRPNKRGVSFRMQGHEPLVLTIGNANHCRIKSGQRWYKAGASQLFKLDIEDTQDALLVCQ